MQSAKEDRGDTHLEASDLKKKIIEDDKVADILTALNCHSIKNGSNLVTAARPDGDNVSAINVYKNTLITFVRTRSTGFNNDNRSDIIDLVEYLKDIYCSQAIYWICELCGYNYYDSPEEKEALNDPCLIVLNEIEPKKSNAEPIMQKLNDGVLGEYAPYPNIWFLNEGIDPIVQREFEVAYSVKDDRIILPIRDEIGTLVGVKSRLIYDSETLPKYLFLYPTPKSRILYGLHKTYPFIKVLGEVIVFESEKSVMKAWTMGYRNCVSIGGHELSMAQVIMLERLGVNITIAFDKDITIKQLKNEGTKFIFKNRLCAIFDNDNLLHEKMSPVDLGIKIWKKLYSTNKYGVH